MNTIIDRSILEKAIRMWGHDSQIEIIEEECIELALALQHLKRKKKDRQKTLENIVDEIADVAIVIEQAHIIFGSIMPGAIDDRIKLKMARLERMIAEDNYNGG